MFGREMRRRSGLVAALAAAGLIAAAGPALAQCSRGMSAFGSLGIGEFRCVGGSCAVNMRTGDPYAHSFSTEPRLGDIDRDGPGGGILRDGDVLVAIDGTLITSAEGGRKLGSLRPGDDVRLTLRRGGREIDARLTAESSCELPRLEVRSGIGYGRTLVSPDGSIASFDATALALPHDSVYGRVWSRVDTIAAPHFATRGLAPGYSLRGDSAWTVYSTLADSAWSRPLYSIQDSSGVSWGLATTPFATITNITPSRLGLFDRDRPPVEFGVELSCGECGWRSGAGGMRFVTAEFPVVESVEKDGPADRAGILPGDRLLSVDGRPITSSGAARALGDLEEGETVTLEIRRGDRIVEVSVTPRAASGRRHRM